MAKVKQLKSMQERLEEAIVPKEQAPFAIPENWCWVKADSIINILNGYAFKSSKYVPSGIRIIRISNVQDGYVVDDTPVYYPFDSLNDLQDFILRENDLLFSLTGNVGRVALLSSNFLPAALNQRVACIRTKIVKQDIKYYFYYFQLPFMQEIFLSEAKGIAQQNLSTESIKRMPIALAPLEEQQRIVDKIGPLFSKLDEAKELIQKSLDEFEDRKSAILHKAFNGELVSFRKPERVTISEVARINPKTKKIICDDNEMVSFVPMRAVSETSGKIKEVLFEKYEKVKKGFTYFENNDVLFAKITPCMENGKGAIAHGLTNGIGMGSTEFHVLRPIDEISSPYWLLALTQMPVFRERAAKNMSGTGGQKRVGASYLEHFMVGLPSIEEQRHFETIYRQVDKSKSYVRIALKNLKSMLGYSIRQVV